MTQLKNTYSTASLKSIFDAIQKVLIAHKAKQIIFDYDGQGAVISLSFVIDVAGRSLAFRMPARVENVERILFPRKSPRTLSVAQREQARRTAWANVRDWIGAQLAMVDIGLVKLEEVFLPYLLEGPGGRTLYEVMEQTQFLLPSGEH